MNRQDPSRRRFLHTAAAVSTAAAGVLHHPLPAFGDLAAVLESDTPVIDTHQHLWDLDRFRLPWTDGNEKLAKNYLIPEYRQAIEGTGIAKAIYMEVGMAKDQQVAEAEWVVELCESGKTMTCAGVIAGQPFEDGFTAYIDRFAKHKCIRGVRHLLQVPESPPGMCLSAAYRKGVQQLGDRGLRFDLCVRPKELADVTQLIAACPDTNFVLDHCGNADPAAFGDADRYDRQPEHTAPQWQRDLEKLAKHRNVVCKISGIVARVVPEQWSAEDLAPIVNHCLDCFGPERVIFASDWPVCTLGAPLAEWVKALRQIVSTRPREEQLLLFAGNARRYYGLD